MIGCLLGRINTVTLYSGSEAVDELIQLLDPIHNTSLLSSHLETKLVRFQKHFVKDHEEDESPIQAIEPHRCLSFGPERKATLREEDSRARARKQSVSGQCSQFHHSLFVSDLYKWDLSSQIIIYKKLIECLHSVS